LKKGKKTAVRFSNPQSGFQPKKTQIFRVKSSLKTASLGGILNQNGTPPASKKDIPLIQISKGEHWAKLSLAKKLLYCCCPIHLFQSQKNQE